MAADMSDEVSLSLLQIKLWVTSESRKLKILKVMGNLQLAS